MKRRLLQIQEETDQTFSLPTESDIAKMIFKAKEDAIKICDNCKIRLNSYDDKHLIKNIEKVVDDAIINHNECEDENDTQLCSSSRSFQASQQTTDDMENVQSVEEHVTIREDLSIIKLRKERSSTFPSYKKMTKPILWTRRKNRTS